jgi:hypothetical protein
MRAIPSCLRAILLLGSLVTWSGCASHRQPIEAPALWHASGFHPTLPDKLFADYEAIFKYIAARETLPQDGRTILGIAADSEVERSYPDPIGTLLVIRAEYYSQSRFGIRGAQGNGRYYAFQMVDGGWRLVGIFHANRLCWESIGNQIRVLAYWHVSAAGSEPTVYTWKGGHFE